MRPKFKRFVLLFDKTLPESRTAKRWATNGLQNFYSNHCWQSNTKCQAERTKPSLFLTNNPEIKFNVCLLLSFPENQKPGRTAN